MEIKWLPDNFETWRSGVTREDGCICKGCWTAPHTLIHADQCPLTGLWEPMRSEYPSMNKPTSEPPPGPGAFCHHQHTVVAATTMRCLDCNQWLPYVSPLAAPPAAEE